MRLASRIAIQSVAVSIVLVLLSLFVNWKARSLMFLRSSGNPDFMPISIAVGALIGIVNLHGLIWSLERLLVAHRATAKLVLVGMFRLIILFGLIIALVALKLVNLLGLVAGMTVVFLILIKEGLKMARQQ